MSPGKCLVFGVGVIRIDVKGVFVQNRAHQIEARILIPAAPFVEISVGKKQQQCDQERAPAIPVTPERASIDFRQLL